MKRNYLVLTVIALVLGIAFFGCKKAQQENLTPKITDDNVEATATTATFTWMVDWIGNRISVVEVSEHEDMSDSQFYGSEEELNKTDFRVTANGLKPGTNYYYRYWVWNHNYVNNKFVFVVKSFSTQTDLPYYEEFTSSFGTYTTYSVTGSQSWEIDYNTAKMTGYLGGSYYVNEDWLISKRFFMENATLTINYIARYFDDNLDNDITVQVSTDYTSGNPTLVSWTQVPVSWTLGSDWSTFTSTTIDLSQFAGQEVTVAIKYLSNNENAGTIEIKSILIQKSSGSTIL